MKFCKDCKHAAGVDISVLRCTVTYKPEALDDEYLVSGVRSLAFCVHARYPGKKCGPDAKLFEPKLKSAA